jgi:hypothetical protein
MKENKANSDQLSALSSGSNDYVLELKAES